MPHVSDGGGTQQQHLLFILCFLVLIPILNVVIIVEFFSKATFVYILISFDCSCLTVAACANNITCVSLVVFLRKYLLRSCSFHIHTGIEILFSLFFAFVFLCLFVLLLLIGCCFFYQHYHHFYEFQIHLIIMMLLMVFKMLLL